MILFVGQIGTEMRDREAFQELDYRRRLRHPRQMGGGDRSSRPCAGAGRRAPSPWRRAGRPGPVVVALPEDMLSAATRRWPDPRSGTEGRRRRRTWPRSPGSSSAPSARSSCVGGGGWATPQARPPALRRGEPPAGGGGLPLPRPPDNESPSYAGDAGSPRPRACARSFAGPTCILAIGLRFGEILTEGYTLFDIPGMAATLIHAHASDAELNAAADRRPAGARPPRPADAGAGQLRLAGSGRWAARTQPRTPTGAPASRRRPSRARSTWARSCATCRRLPDDAILTNGAGNFATWTNKHFAFTARPAAAGAAGRRHGLRRAGRHRRQDRATRSGPSSPSPATATSR